jgi:acyl-coenzyme A synthetase/AMP-(fatty) acid ligase
MKGQAISAFVILKEGHAASPALGEELKAHVVKKIGAIARPEVPKARRLVIRRRWPTPPWWRS